MESFSDTGSTPVASTIKGRTFGPAFFLKRVICNSSHQEVKNMRASEKDIKNLTDLVKIVWPENSKEDLTRIILEYMDSDESAVFACKQGDNFAGVALCCLRHDYVEGCDTSPVGYLEGVSVKEEFRNMGIAKSLVEECEQWAREKGCKEFASDCELSNTASLNFHLQIGFTEQNRIICFKKDLY